MKKFILTLICLLLVGISGYAANHGYKPAPDVIYDRQPEPVVDSRQLNDYGVGRIETPNGWLVIAVDGKGGYQTTFVPDANHYWKLGEKFNSFTDAIDRDRLRKIAAALSEKEHLLELKQTALEQREADLKARETKFSECQEDEKQ